MGRNHSRQFDFIHFLFVYPEDEFTIPEFSSKTGIPIPTLYRHFKWAEERNMIRIAGVRRQFVNSRRSIAGRKVGYLRLFRRNIKVRYVTE